MPLELQAVSPKSGRFAATSAQIFESMIKGKVVRNVRTLDMKSALPTAIINFTDGSSVEVSQLGVEVYVQYRRQSTSHG